MTYILIKCFILIERSRLDDANTDHVVIIIVIIFCFNLLFFVILCTVIVFVSKGCGILAGD